MFPRLSSLVARLSPSPRISPRALLAATAICTFGAAFDPSPAQAQSSEWDRNAKRCMEAFRRFDKVGLRELYECSALWEAYRSPSGVKQGERLTAIQAFNFLCANGDEDESYLAEQAIYRLGQTPTEACLKRQSGPAQGVVMAETAPSRPQAPEDSPEEARSSRARSKYDPPAVPASQTDRARKMVADGHAAEKKKREDDALRHYEEAIKTDPRHEMAIYNAARMYARGRQEAAAMEYLLRLRDLASEIAIDQLRKARMHADFTFMRERDDFKELTGYAKIKLCNSKGEMGDDPTEYVKESLAKAQWPVYEECDYGQDLPFPVVFFKMGPARNTAVILTGLIPHPNVQLQEVEEDREWDVAIVWGDTYKVDAKGRERPERREHKDPEQQMRKVREQEEKALREPDRFARETEHRARTPERVQSSMESNVRRVEQTQKGLERAGGAAGKLLNGGK